MKTILTFASLAGGALILAACGGKAEEAPAAEPTAAEMMAPVEETPAVEELDPTGNPIGPDDMVEEAPAAAEAPAAE